MTTPANISAPVSFGLDVRRPGLLETRSTGDVLLGIQSGAWLDTSWRLSGRCRMTAQSKNPPNSRSRLRHGRASFRAVQTPGLFDTPGKSAIDLDGLGEAGAVSVLQTAVADSFCLAAFRSARGEGVRLIFRIPPCSPENHAAAFEQVAEHVRKTYGRDADPIWQGCLPRQFRQL